MDTELAGKVVIVTGATGGIGACLARAFAAEGAKVVVHFCLQREAAAALANELKPAESLVVGADLAREADAKRLFALALNQFGRVDTLVANAGAWETTDVPLHEMTLRQWRQTLRGVLTTTFLTLREFLRVVATQKRGNAILIGSTAAVFGEAGHGDYAAGKSALSFGLMRSVKNELPRIAPHTADYCGGRINCICPGWTVVPRLDVKLKDPSMVRKAMATMALPQLARPVDVANMAVFLASDKLARHVTGQTLLLAGGMEGRLLWQPAELDPSTA